MKLSEALLLDAEFWVADNGVMHEISDTLMLNGMYVKCDQACIDACLDEDEVGLMAAAENDILTWFSLLVSASVADEEE